jgi:hypothetical protein
MRGWGKGKKALAAFGGLFVLGSLLNATNPQPKSNITNTKTEVSEAKQETPIVIVPNPAPKVDPTPAPEPVPTPALTPPAPISRPTPQPSSNCDPNYSGCVPIASDVDCAGGSGNGPAYVAGPIQVLGSDIYDLDRDSDGVACE